MCALSIQVGKKEGRREGGKEAHFLPASPNHASDHQSSQSPYPPGREGLKEGQHIHERLPTSD